MGCIPEEPTRTHDSPMLRSLPLKRLGGGSCGYTAAISLLAIYNGIDELIDQNNPLTPFKIDEIVGFADAKEELIYAQKVKDRLRETIRAIKNGEGRDLASEKNKLLVSAVDEYKTKMGKNFPSVTTAPKLAKYNICSATNFMIYVGEILKILRAPIIFSIPENEFVEIYPKSSTKQDKDIMGITIGLPKNGGVAGVSGFHAVTIFNKKNVFGSDGYLLVDDLKDKVVPISNPDVELLSEKSSAIIILYK